MTNKQKKKNSKKSSIKKEWHYRVSFIEVEGYSYEIMKNIF